MKRLTKNVNKMQNIDKKVTLILKLNAKLKRVDFYIDNNFNNKIIEDDIKKAHSLSLLIYRVLTNLNYLNY